MNKKDLEPNLESADKAIKKAQTEYKKYKDKCKRDDVMVVVDYTQPSYKQRLFVVDVASSAIFNSHHCAHGVNSSDPRNKANSINFSNEVGSHMSSLGAMVTNETYRGKHGRSLRLEGLEKGKNDNVRRRAIVIHAATYCTDGYILSQGRAGQSHGCPAVDETIADKLIEQVRGGVFYYSYYK